MGRAGAAVQAVGDEVGGIVDTLRQVGEELYGYERIEGDVEILTLLLAALRLSYNFV